MFKPPPLASADLGDCNWSGDELTRLKAYVKDLPPWEPKSPQAPGIGHNEPRFDDVVEENRRHGLYLAQRDVLVRAIRDPSLPRRHRIVLAEVILAMNTKSGMAFPGYAFLAERTGYSIDTIRVTIHDLVAKFGYLTSSRRAPEPGKRALAHYTIVRPTVEEMQAAIAAHVQELRKQSGRAGAWEGDRPWEPDLNPTVEVSEVVDLNPRVENGEADFNPRLEVGNGADFNPVGPADFNPVVETVTCKGTGRKNPPTPQGVNGLTFLLDGQAVNLKFAFDIFWRVFPVGRKKGAGGAADLFSAIATGKHPKRQATVQEMVDCARRYAARRPDPTYVPLPKTWLNDGRWADDVDEHGDADAARARHELEGAIAQLRAEEAVECRR